ncbi:MAG: hypothetical protein Fur0037_00280 [Planctomycetota bacterium]
MRIRTASPLLAAVLAAALHGPAAAQGEGHPAVSILKTVDPDSSMEDRIGARVDTALQFRDERGYPLSLRQFFPGTKPVILQLGYFACPGLCGDLMNGMAAALSQIDLLPARDYEILSISIDPRENSETSTLARDKKRAYLEIFHKEGAEAGWHFATGEQEAIRALTDQVGFRYYWAEHEGRFDHPPALIFLSPDGVVARVLQGTSFSPRDVDLAIKEAAEGRLSTFWDSVLLSCLTYDPNKRTYALTAMTVMKVGGAVTVLGLAAAIAFLFRKERTRRSRASA